MKDKKSNEVKETKKKKHIVRYVLLGILILIVLVVGIFFVKNAIEKSNSKKFNDTINELSKDRTDYVFIEINPSFVLSIKDSKVSDIACLNDDCVSIYNDINVKGKTINESIDVVYNVSKEKGFDTSNGVKVKTTGNIDIDNKDYVTVEYINETTKNELLSNVKNNESIKDNNNDDYYTNLWNELKQDSDYDNIYSCNMEDKELKCYFTDKFISASEENSFNGLSYSSLQKVLDKFGIKYDTWKYGVYGVYINNEFYYIVNNELTRYGDIPECEQDKSKSVTAYVTCATVYGDLNKITRVPLEKLNLLTKQYNSEDILHN